MSEICVRRNCGNIEPEHGAAIKRNTSVAGNITGKCEHWRGERTHALLVRLDGPR